MLRFTNPAPRKRSPPARSHGDGSCLPSSPTSQGPQPQPLLGGSPSSPSTTGQSPVSMGDVSGVSLVSSSCTGLAPSALRLDLGPLSGSSPRPQLWLLLSVAYGMRVKAVGPEAPLHQ